MAGTMVSHSWVTSLNLRSSSVMVCARRFLGSDNWVMCTPNQIIDQVTVPMMVRRVG